MGELTNAMIAVANLRQDQQRTQLYQQGQLAEESRRNYEFEQRRQDAMFQQAEALSQYRQTRRDKLAADHESGITKMLELQQSLDKIRTRAHSEELLTGQPSKLTQRSMVETERLLSDLYSINRRRQQQIDSDDSSVEMLTALSAGNGVGGGGEGEAGGGEAPAQSAEENGGVGPYQEMGPEEAPMDNATFLQNVSDGLSKKGLSGGQIKNGMIRFDVNSEDEAKAYQSIIDSAGEELKMKLPAMVVNREPVLRAAVQDYFKLRDDQRQFNNRIQSYKSALRDPKAEMLQAMYRSAQESGDDEQMGVFFSAMNASEEERKSILRGAIEVAETARAEDDQLLKQSKSAADEWYRINGLGPIQDDTAAPPKKDAAAAPADGGKSPPAGMNREQFGKWFVENVSRDTADLPKLKAAWNKYNSGG